MAAKRTKKIAKGQRVNITASSMQDLNNRVLENSADIKAFMAGLAAVAEADVDKLCKAQILEIYGELADRTPKDTGRAAAGWTISMDGDNSTPLEGVEYAEGPKDSRTLKREVRDEQMKNLGEIPPLGPYTVSNNVEYVLPLEHGSSFQAPEGFFALTLMNARNRVEARLKKLNSQVIE